MFSREFFFYKVGLGRNGLPSKHYNQILRKSFGTAGWSGPSLIYNILHSDHNKCQALYVYARIRIMQ